MKKKSKNIKEDISETKGEINIQKKRGKPIHKGKKRFTRPTTKLRLNAKAALNPALKSKEPICTESNSPNPSMKTKKIRVSSSPTDFLLQLSDVTKKLEVEDIKHTRDKKRKWRHGKWLYFFLEKIIRNPSWKLSIINEGSRSRDSYWRFFIPDFKDKARNRFFDTLHRRINTCRFRFYFVIKVFSNKSGTINFIYI